MKIYLVTLISATIAYGVERPEDSPNQGSPLPKTNAAISTGEVYPEDQQNASLVLPWLGVLGEQADETLLMHLGIQEGLVLRKIDNTSPAFIAGLRLHDIILSVNDTPIENQQILKDVIYSFKPGETVSMNIISKGKARLMEVTLGSRPVSQFYTPQLKEKALDSHPQSSANPSFGRMFNDLLKEADPKISFGLDFQSTSSIKMMDEKGSVEMRVLDGEQNVIVKDKSGIIQFEGPWSEEAKENAPNEVRKRVENINFNFRNHNLKLLPQRIREKN